MREFWAKEKATLVSKGGFTIADEYFKIVSGWNVVLYTVRIQNTPPQKNLRACRVLGDTWVDVHLSTMRANATWTKLEDVVSALVLAKKN